MTKNCIVYITQNNEIRKNYLKTSLYFLFKNFNDTYKNDILIFHEGDYKEYDKKEIISCIRSEENKNLIKFIELSKEDFSIPEFIDIEKLNAKLENPPVPYWRNIPYRNMCRFWSIKIHKYIKNYQYYMRLDDDSIIEEKINTNLFDILINNNLDYCFNILHSECHICSYDFKKFIKKYCNNNNINYMNNENLKKYFPEKSLSPIIFYNNFHISKVDFWFKKDVRHFLDEIDKTGQIYYQRWGDALIHTYVILLFSNKFLQLKFNYSKRMQRESCDFNNTGNFIQYFPDNYKSDSSLTLI